MRSRCASTCSSTANDHARSATAVAVLPRGIRDPGIPPAQTLARHHILSAPLVVSPGLEDVESLSPGESAPQLLGMHICQLCCCTTSTNLTYTLTFKWQQQLQYFVHHNIQQCCLRALLLSCDCACSSRCTWQQAMAQVLPVHCSPTAAMLCCCCCCLGWLDVKDIIKAFLACEQAAAAQMSSSSTCACLYKQTATTGQHQQVPG
jgi:hypothetical protein